MLINKEKKVIHIAVDAQPLCHPELTGIGRVTQELVKKLSSDNRFVVTVQGCVMSNDVEEALHKNLSFLDKQSIRIYKIPSRIAYGLYYLFPFLYSLLFGKSDIFISFNYMLPVGVCGKKIVFVHDMVVKRFPETMESTMRKVLNITLRNNCKRADRIITISQFSKNEICELLGVAESKISVIPLAVDADVFNNEMPFSQIKSICEKYSINAPYFVYVGTLEPRKNIVRLIEAYAKLIHNKSNAPLLVLVGKKGWLYDEIFEKIKAFGIEKNVIFTGFVPDSDLPCLMAGAKAFLFPSLYEGFGLPPLEAMACGTPVLCSSAASLPEVVGDAGLMVNPFDVDAISCGMEQLSQNENLCQELQKKGLARAKQFNWDGSSDSLIQAIEELIC